MNETTTTPPLPSGFARTARAFEALSDADAIPLIETAETNTDGEKRRVALDALGMAGILPPINWVPLTRKINVSPVYSVPAPLPDGPIVATGVLQAVAPFVEEAKYEAERRTLGKCTPPRERHRYTKSGETCKVCGVKNPRSKIGPPSLADILKAEKAAQNVEGSNPSRTAPCTEHLPGGEGAGCIPHGGTSTADTSALDLLRGCPEGRPTAEETAYDRMHRLRAEEIVRSLEAELPAPAASIAATPITTAVSFAEAMGELEAVLSPNLSGDDGYAAWVVGKILDRQAQIQRVEAQAREMVAQLHNDLSGLAYRFKQPLQEYARRLIESSGRKGQRSVKTLSGTLGFRGGDGCVPTLSVADPERLREWCLEQPDAEQFGAYTFVPDKAKVLAWAKATGEVPRGVEAKAQPEAFFVKSADGVSVNLSKLSAPALPAPDEQEE